MSERYVGWRCGKCDAPIAGAYSTCGECGFGPKAHLLSRAATVAPLIAGGEAAMGSDADEAAYRAAVPTERDRNRDAANRALNQWDIARIPGAIEDEIAAARAEGRAEAIEECARIVDGKRAADYEPYGIASILLILGGELRALAQAGPASRKA